MKVMTLQNHYSMNIIKYKVKPSGDIETTDISNTASWTWDGAGEAIILQQ